MKFSLRLKDSEIYMGGTNMDYPEAVSKTYADIMKLIPSKSYPHLNLIEVFTKGDKVLESDNEKNLVYSSIVNSKKEQHFNISVNPDGTYRLVSKERCIGFDEKSGFFMVLRCNDINDNQKFEVEIVDFVSMNKPIPVLKNSLKRSILFKNKSLGRTHVAQILKNRRAVEIVL
ncbi:hypothetical protein DMUE_0156 [Dictyocoela muelleri]|nr:hypothetical protein DMUE_0156 [Dictyocoela muelleri]